MFILVLPPSLPSLPKYRLVNTATFRTVCTVSVSHETFIFTYLQHVYHTIQHGNSLMLTCTARHAIYTFHSMWVCITLHIRS